MADPVTLEQVRESILVDLDEGVQETSVDGTLVRQPDILKRVQAMQIMEGIDPTVTKRKYGSLRFCQFVPDGSW